MHTMSGFKLLVAGCFLLSTASHAAPSPLDGIRPNYTVNLQQHAYQPTPLRAGLRAAGAGVTPVATAGDVVTNPARAYPPSCLGNIVPFGLYVDDPHGLQAQITLPGDPLGSSTEQGYSEVDTVTVFRVPCSGGKSALLMEIDRPTAANGDRNLYPIFPIATMQSIAPCASPGCPVFVPRLAPDPNTFFSDTYAASPL